MVFWCYVLYIPRLLMHPSDCYGAVGFNAMPNPSFRFLVEVYLAFSETFWRENNTKL